MAKTIANIIGFGGDDTAVFVAASDATPPTGLSTPGTGYDDVGWIGPDGINLDWSEDETEFRGHQANTIVKRKITGVNQSFTFQCLEANAVVLGIAFKGTVGVLSGTGDTAAVTYTLDNLTRSDARQWVIDEYGDTTIDGDPSSPQIVERWIIPSGVATISSGRQYVTTEMTVWEFTVGVQGSVDFVTNAPDVVASLAP